MVLLTRIVRFALTPGIQADRGPNGYAGNPPMSGLGAHYELVVTCRGEIDPTVGYLINIKEIDHAVRTDTIPQIQQALFPPLPDGGGRVEGVGQPQPPRASDRSHLPTPHSPLPPASPLHLLPTLFHSLPLRGLQTLRWRLSPYYSVEMSAPAPTTVLLRQKFDFCAAHRLHAPQLSPEENRKLFGKCNNPSGHGHNYQFEPCIAITLDSPLGEPVYNRLHSPSFSLSDLERLADELIVQRFDHKNLNTDTDEFRDGSGLNPSVENIAKVCFNILAPAIAREGSTAKLQSITVWESDRTSCTYPG